MNLQKQAMDNCIVLAYTGSILYGTDNEKSDIDLQGVFIPAPDFVIGTKTCEKVCLTKELSAENILQEQTLYSLPKYLNLARNCNPNLISLLFSDEPIRQNEKYWGPIYHNRDKIVSMKAYHTFMGYAYAQKNKITTKQNTTGKRKAIIEEHGYDVKFAMHLIRLLYECYELIVTGKIVYPSTIRRTLCSIRAGEYTLEHVLDLADIYEEEINNITANKEYVIRDIPDDEFLNKLQQDLLLDYWKETRQINV